jgi:hypothetical protein
MRRKDSLLAFDPGLNNPAAALFREGRLIAASRISLERTWKSLPVGERCRRIAGATHEWACANGLDMAAMVKAYENDLHQYHEEARLLRQHLGIVALVVEWPQIYVRGRQKGDPNDLLPLAGVAMALAGRLDVEVRSYRPAEWIGQCAKAETGDPLASPRGQIIWRELDPAERSTVRLSHDAIDATGLGLAALGRLHMRVYPGAS